jgi:chromosome segregation ATPase
MCKKLLIAAVAVVIGLVVVRNTRVGGYLRVWKDRCAHWAEKQVTPEMEIARLRGDLDRLDLDVKMQYSGISEETVLVEELQADVTALEEKLAAKRKRILTMKEDLSKDTKFIVYGGKEFSHARVKAELRRDFAAFKSLEKQLAAQKKLLAARENGLNQAREQLAGLESTRDNLRVKLAELEADLKTLRVAQTRSPIAFDAGKLGSIKKGVADLERRLKIETKKFQLEETGAEKPLPVGEKAKPDNLLKEIEDHPTLKTSGEKVAGK